MISRFKAINLTIREFTYAPRGISFRSGLSKIMRFSIWIKSSIVFTVTCFWWHFMLISGGSHDFTYCYYTYLMHTFISKIIFVYFDNLLQSCLIIAVVIMFWICWVLIFTCQSLRSTLFFYWQARQCILVFLLLFKLTEASWCFLRRHMF